jgi:hypothetical protein
MRPRRYAQPELINTDSLEEAMIAIHMPNSNKALKEF